MSAERLKHAILFLAILLGSTRADPMAALATARDCTDVDTSSALVQQAAALVLQSQMKTAFCRQAEGKVPPTLPTAPAALFAALQQRHGLKLLSACCKDAYVKAWDFKTQPEPATTSSTKYLKVRMSWDQPCRNESETLTSISTVDICPATAGHAGAATITTESAAGTRRLGRKLLDNAAVTAATAPAATAAAQPGQQQALTVPCGPPRDVMMASVQVPL